jgi:hypothetical protein
MAIFNSKLLVYQRVPLSISYILFLLILYCERPNRNKKLTWTRGCCPNLWPQLRWFAILGANRMFTKYHALFDYFWLAVLPLLKNMTVNGKDDIPYIMEINKGHVWNHQPDFHAHQPLGKNIGKGHSHSRGRTFSHAQTSGASGFHPPCGFDQWCNYDSYRMSEVLTREAGGYRWSFILTVWVTSKPTLWICC